MTATMPAVTMLDRLREHALRIPGTAAYTFLDDDGTTERALTYADLDRQVQAVAATLSARLRPGDRALLLLPEGLDFVPVFLGCLRAGVIAVPAYPPLPVQSRQRLDTLRAIVRDCRPVAVITAASPDAVAAIQAVTPELSGAWWASADELLASSGDPIEFGPDPADIAFLQYTSGSTSTPKGVVVPHGALVHHEGLISDYMAHEPGTRLVSWLPLFHDMGLIGAVLQPLWLGGSALLMTPMSFIKRPVRWLRAISDYRGQTNGGPNFAYELCARRVRDEDCAGLDLSSWRVAFNGAEPIRADTMRIFTERFARHGFDPVAWYPCYGMAEATLMVTGAQVHQPHRTLTVDRDALHTGRAIASATGQTLVSSGIARGERTVLIVDPDSRRRLPDGEVGEIWVGGPSLPSGYWGNPEATERTFHARPVDGPDEPHMRTGDLGFLDDGELYVTGRLKDVVIVGGRNHYPQDIELTVEGAHDAIRQSSVAAFSYEDGEAERVVVVVGVGQGATGTGPAAGAKRTEIVRAVRAAVAADHGITLDDIVLVAPNAVPKTSSGKLRRGACRAAYLNNDYSRERESEGDR